MGLKEQLDHHRKIVRNLEETMNSLQSRPKIEPQSNDPLEFLKQKLQAVQEEESRQGRLAHLQAELAAAHEELARLHEVMNRHRRAVNVGMEHLRDAARQANELLDQAREAVQNLERIGAAFSKDYQVVHGGMPIYSTLDSDYFLLEYPYIAIGETSVKITRQSDRNHSSAA